MSPNVLILRLLVEQRLTAAAEEIFGLFERTIVEYEEELCRIKEENQRQRQILDSVLNPRVLIHKTDVQELFVVKEEVPPDQQEWNPIVDQVEPEAEPPQIKEEQEDLWASQEINTIKFLSTPVPVKSKDNDDEEKVKSSQLNQTQTEENKVEANKVDCGRSEPSSSFHLHRYLQTKTDEQNEECEETKNSDEDQTLNHQPELMLPTNSSTEQMEIETDEDDGGSEPDINLVHMDSLLEEHMNIHTGQRLVGSSECEATFSQKENMNNDLTLSDVGYEKKLYQCSVCLKTFSSKSYIKIHMRVHTGLSHGFDCSVCGKKLTSNSILTTHMRLHTGEKPFSCSKCSKTFIQKKSLERHMRLHTGERPYSCSECSKRFTQMTSLKNHMRLHTGERPFSCVVCQKSFRRKHHLTIHMKIHMRE